MSVKKTKRWMESQSPEILKLIKAYREMIDREASKREIAERQVRDQARTIKKLAKELALAKVESHDQ